MTGWAGPPGSHTSCFLLHFQALDCFRQAASEVGREEFLDRLIQPEEGEVVSTPRLQYYSKVQLSLPRARCPDWVSWHPAVPHRACSVPSFLGSDLRLSKYYFGRQSLCLLSLGGDGEARYFPPCSFLGAEDLVT